MSSREFELFVDFKAIKYSRSEVCFSAVFSYVAIITGALIIDGVWFKLCICIISTCAVDISIAVRMHKCISNVVGKLI
jgi:hypothetical protein